MNNHISIRQLNTQELELSYQFIINNGWAHRINSLEMWEKTLQNSQRVVAAVIDNQIIGFARGITDEVSNGYLSMVVVAPEYRQQGVGRALINHIIEGNPAITWVLRAGRDGAETFFSKLGFNLSSIAMERLRA